MSLIFWRKRDSYNNEAAVVVSKDDPLPVSPQRPEDTDDPQPVTIEQVSLPPVEGRTVTRRFKVPGIGTGAAYADGEAFGTPIIFNDVFRSEKRSGVIVGAFLIDLDDEGIQVDVPIFVRPIAGTADNSAFAPTDQEALGCVGVISISSFYNWNANQFGQASNLGIWVNGDDVHLYTQLVIRGAANIAAGAEPWIGLIVLPD